MSFKTVLLEPPAPGAAPEGNPSAHADWLLVQGCLAQEPGAWERLYRLCQPRLEGAIRAMLGSRRGDGELVQELASRVWFNLVQDDHRLLRRFDPRRGCRLTTFLSLCSRSVVKSHCRSERRRRRRERRMQATRPPAAAQSLEGRWAFEEFVATLSPREREFLSRCLLACPSREDRAGFTAANTWQLGHRIRRKLRQYFRSAGAAPGRRGAAA